MFPINAPPPGEKKIPICVLNYKMVKYTGVYISACNQFDHFVFGINATNIKWFPNESLHIA